MPLHVGHVSDTVRIIRFAYLFIGALAMLAVLSPILFLVYPRYIILDTDSWCHANDNCSYAAALHDRARIYKREGAFWVYNFSYDYRNGNALMEDRLTSLK